MLCLFSDNVVIVDVVQSLSRRQEKQQQQQQHHQQQQNNEVSVYRLSSLLGESKKVFRRLSCDA
jgi:hypothetical protein